MVGSRGALHRTGLGRCEGVCKHRAGQTCSHGMQHHLPIASSTASFDPGRANPLRLMFANGKKPGFLLEAQQAQYRQAIFTFPCDVSPRCFTHRSSHRAPQVTAECSDSRWDSAPLQTRERGGDHSPQHPAVFEPGMCTEGTRSTASIWHKAWLQTRAPVCRVINCYLPAIITCFLSASFALLVSYIQRLMPSWGYFRRCRLYNIYICATCLFLSVS